MRHRANRHEVFRGVQSGNRPDQFLSLRKIGSQFFFSYRSQVKGDGAASILHGLVDGKTDFVPWHSFWVRYRSAFLIDDYSAIAQGRFGDQKTLLLGKDRRMELNHLHVRQSSACIVSEALAVSRSSK